VRQTLFQKCGDQGGQAGHSRAIIAAQGCLFLRDDARTFAHRPGSGTKRHSVEVSRKQEPRPFHRARKSDDKVSCLGWKWDLRVGSVEPNCLSRHTGPEQVRQDRFTNHFFFSRDALDGQETHQSADCLFFIESQIIVARHSVLLALI